MARPKTLHQSWPAARRIGRHCWPHLRQQRALIGGSMAALVGSIFLRLLEPWPLKFIFDRVIAIGPGARPAGPAVLDALDAPTLLAVSAAMVVFVTGLRALASYVSTVGFAVVGNRVVSRVRDDLYRHLHGLSLSFHSRARSGDLIVRITGDVNLLRDAAVTAVLPLLANVLVLAGMVALMFWLQWQLTLLATAALPLFWFSTRRVGRRIRETARRQRHSEGAIAATVAESMSAMKIVQALSLEALFARDFVRQGEKSLKEEAVGRRLSASLERTVDVLVAVSTALVLWRGGHLVLIGALTPGDLLVFLTYLRRAFNPLQDFAKYSARLAKATAAGERVLDLLERTPDVQDRPDAVVAPPFRGSVQFEDVSFEYEPGRRVLDRLSFEVGPGQHVALVGPSGAGKSTLVSLILRLYDPSAGRVLVDGRDLREYTIASLRSQISIVLQDNVLFAASVWDNIACGVATATRDDIVAVARLANADSFVRELPQGYDTILGERGATLSQGQRQRLAIARAAVRKTPILIFDEPTAGLDEVNCQAVTEALERLAARRTVFLISHDLRLTVRAHAIFWLDDGRVCERGTHEQLLQSGGRYDRFYRLREGRSTAGRSEVKSHALSA